MFICKICLLSFLVQQLFFKNINTHNIKNNTLTFILPSNLDFCKNRSIKTFALLTEREKLGRPHAARKALLRALSTQVLRHGRIITTVSKAKIAQRKVDRMITYAKKKDRNHARRLLSKYLYDRQLIENMLEQVPTRFGERHGGYTRVKILHTRRTGDNARMAVLELLEY